MPVAREGGKAEKGASLKSVFDASKGDPNHRCEKQLEEHINHSADTQPLIPVIILVFAAQAECLCMNKQEKTCKQIL